MRRVLAISLAAATILLGGIRPRNGVADYPAHEAINNVEFGAAIIPGSQVKKIFGADLNGAGYVVIEIGVFPSAGRDVDLSSLDFTLLTDQDSFAERTADIGPIVTSAVKDGSSPPRIGDKDISVTTGVSVEHASYPDPVTGRRTGSTIIGEGVGVGVGPSGPQTPFPPGPSSGPTRYQLEQDLLAKSLPDGNTTMPVAGYLYFPKPAKKAKNGPWVLQWEATSGRVRVTLPNTAK